MSLLSLFFFPIFFSLIFAISFLLAAPCLSVFVLRQGVSYSPLIIAQSKKAKMQTATTHISVNTMLDISLRRRRALMAERLNASPSSRGSSLRCRNR